MLSKKPPYLIINTGLSGKAALRLLKVLGVSPQEIFTYDSSDTSADFNNAEVAYEKVRPQTIIVSPGYPLSTPWIQRARSANVEITSELSLAAPFFNGELKIGITGSVGKSTTAGLLNAGASVEDPNCFLGGNYGYPLANYVADVLERKRPRARIAIIEISSYQLENARGLSFDHSIITSLNENHLERYASLDHYYLTKLSLLFRTQGHVVLNENGHDLFSYVNNLIAYFPENGLRLSLPNETAETAMDRVLLGFSRSQLPSDLTDVRQVLSSSLKKHDNLKQIHWTSSRFTDRCEIIGRHNRENLSLALRLGQILAFKPASLNAIRSFRGLPHRIENLGVSGGIRFINDSKSTTIESVLVALEACSDFSRTGTLFVLIGGRDKNLPWRKLQAFQGAPNMEFVFFGECAEFASQETRLSKNIHRSLGAALSWCKLNAQDQDTLLLSPGGSSLDEFKNFEERGNFFKSKMQDFSVKKAGGR